MLPPTGESTENLTFSFKKIRKAEEDLRSLLVKHGYSVEPETDASDLINNQNIQKYLQ
jgi:hypothetical protein